MKTIKEQLMGKMTREELLDKCNNLIEQTKLAEERANRAIESYKKKLDDKKKVLSNNGNITRKKPSNTLSDKELALHNQIASLKEKSEAKDKQMSNMNRVNNQRKKDFVALDLEYKFLKERVKEVFGRAIFAELLRHESNPRDFSERDYDGIRRGEAPFSLWTIYNNVKKLLKRRPNEGYFRSVLTNDRQENRTIH